MSVEIKGALALAVLVLAASIFAALIVTLVSSDQFMSWWNKPFNDVNIGDVCALLIVAAAFARTGRR